MSNPRLYSTEAVVLRKIDLGEADSLVTLYTPHLGKIRAVARGVRRSRSKLGGHVEWLVHAQMLLARSKGLDIISQSQAINSFVPLRDNLWRSSSALYVAELVDRLTPEGEEDYPLFKLLADTLQWLCRAHHTDLVLRRFEMHLFGRLGYEPELYHCVACHSAIEPGEHYFTPDGGGVLCSGCGGQALMVDRLSLDALKVLRFLQRSGYAEVDRLRLSADLSANIKLIMRRYVRYLLERELKSADWLDRLEREGLAR